MLQKHADMVYNKYMFKLPGARIGLLRAVVVIMAFFALASAILATFFTIYIRVPVKGMSMAPSLNSQYAKTGARDVVYINRFAKQMRGDIVVLDVSKNSNFKTEKFIIKRLIAVEGDTVNIVFDSATMKYNVLVNGRVIYSKPYQEGGYHTYDCFDRYMDDIDIAKTAENELIIGKDEIFVLGDNWDVSIDSSMLGPF